MNEIIKIVKSFRESVLLKKSVSEAIKNKAKRQRDEFLSMLLDALGASLLVNLLVGKGVMTACKVAIRACQDR